MELGRKALVLQQERLLHVCQRPWRTASGAGPPVAILAGDLRSLQAALRKARLWPRKNSSSAFNSSAIRASWKSFSFKTSTADFDGDRDHSQDNNIAGDQNAIDKSSSDRIQHNNAKHKGNLQAAAIVSGLTALGTVAALTSTFASGGPAALIAAISKSGFFAAFALIFVSEIGDKTFFIAALLAMRHSRGLVLLGSMGALSLMTVISVVIGRLFQRVPAQLQTTLPIGEYAAVALLLLFGIKAIKEAWDLPSSPPGSKDAVADSGELAEAEEVVKQVQVEKKLSTPMTVLAETFSLVFLAEWGDRSMLATVALGAAQSPWGVASGAIVGHTLATLLAVLGGAFLAQYISEKVVGYTGGILFLAFAVATLLGAF